ncbi:MAG: tyrosine-type recombinase/integrase [Candidatus Dormibacteria bacterium]
MVAIPASAFTLDQLAELFSRSTGKESSSREYRGVLLSFTRFAKGEGVCLCSDLDFPLLLSYQASLSQLAPSTRHHRLLFLRQFLRFAERSRLARPGLAEGLRLQPLPPHHPRPAISLDDSLLLISAAPDRRAQLLVLLLLATGARISELLACNVSSCQDGLLYLCGKTGTRAVPLAGSARSQLEGELAARGEEDSSAPLFRSRQGRLSDRRAREILARCCRLANLPLLSPHDLRHAACARWLRAGIPLVVVSRTLGHSRPSTTLDHYASVTAHDLERGLSADPLEQGLQDSHRPPPVEG